MEHLALTGEDILSTKAKKERGKNMKKLYLSIVFIVVPLLFMFGCGDALKDLTSRDIKDVEVDMGSFTLTGTGGGAGLTLTASPGNPSCGTANLEELLASVSDYEDNQSHIDKIKIQDVQYRITINTTGVDVTGSLQMTDPNSGFLADIGSASIAANTTMGWTNLPFATGGESIIQYYLDNRGSTFTYCAEGAPDDASLSMTIEMRSVVTITVSL